MVGVLFVGGVPVARLAGSREPIVGSLDFGNVLYQIDEVSDIGLFDHGDFIILAFISSEQALLIALLHKAPSFVRHH